MPVSKCTASEVESGVLIRSAPSSGSACLQHLVDDSYESLQDATTSTDPVLGRTLLRVELRIMDCLAAGVGERSKGTRTTPRSGTLFSDKAAWLVGKQEAEAGRVEERPALPYRPLTWLTDAAARVP